FALRGPRAEVSDLWRSAKYFRSGDGGGCDSERRIDGEGGMEAGAHGKRRKAASATWECAARGGYGDQSPSDQSAAGGCWGERRCHGCAGGCAQELACQ